MEHLETLSSYKHKVGVCRSAIKEINEELDEILEMKTTHIKARELMQRAATLTQSNLADHLSSIVSKALDIVFEEESPKFIVRFVTRRNTTECDMFFSDDGINEMDPLDSCGFGAVDVASFALRVAIWALSKSRPVLIADEPFRNLDAERMPRASVMVKILSDELGLQMIIVTHEEDLKECSDKVFVVTKTKEGSTIKEK